MPNSRIISFRDFSTRVFETPQDDEHTSTYMIDASRTMPLDRQLRLRRSGLSERFYRKSDFIASWSDGLGQDREAMRANQNWSAYHGISQEDAIVSMSMGPRYDRTQEHLVPADAAVVRVRRRLLDSLQRMEAGEPPLGVMSADMTRMKAFDVDWDIAKPWQDIAPEHKEHFREKAESL